MRMDPPDLDQLRNDVALRFEQHPHMQWSAAFLRVLRDVFDLEFGPPHVDGGPESGGRRLTLVR